MDSPSTPREPVGKIRRSKQQSLPDKPTSLHPVSCATNYGAEPGTTGESAHSSTESPSTDVPSLGTVLFVSDDDFFRTTVRAYLEHVGLSVRSSADAARVPELFFRKPAIDLLLVDVHAIGMTGLLLAAELTAFTPDLPVIIVAAPNGENSGAFEAISGQNWRFLRKPVLLPELLEAIHASLGKPDTSAAWNTPDPPIAGDEVAPPQSRCVAVPTEVHRTPRRSSRPLVMQGTS